MRSCSKGDIRAYDAAVPPRGAQGAATEVLKKSRSTCTLVPEQRHPSGGRNLNGAGSRGQSCAEDAEKIIFTLFLTILCLRSNEFFQELCWQSLGIVAQNLTVGFQYGANIRASCFARQSFSSYLSLVLLAQFMLIIRNLAFQHIIIYKASVYLGEFTPGLPFLCLDCFSSCLGPLLIHTHSDGLCKRPSLYGLRTMESLFDYVRYFFAALEWIAHYWARTSEPPSPPTMLAFLTNIDDSTGQGVVIITRKAVDMCVYLFAELPCSTKIPDWCLVRHSSTTIPTSYAKYA